MEVDEKLVQQIAEAVIRELQVRESGGEGGRSDNSGISEAVKVSENAAGGKDSAENGDAGNQGNRGDGAAALTDKVDYSGYPQARQGTDPKEVVIGVGAAFGTVIKNTITGIPLDEVIKAIIAGIEEEGMTARVVKNLKTSDVCFIGLEAAKLSGSGFGIGLQSKGTAVIHHKALYPLSNLELFPQAPQMTLETYFSIGKNAARYVKGEKVVPVPGTNDPMVRAKYQVKAALMHIRETDQLCPELNIIEWAV
ncbi:MAG: propanediol/glycerol family dehydratase medium subunit [Lachnospiraceae bacterium]|nr:propanediol/glycerol family dehydratase medium subunit [Lachnospiraceae bacterium]